MVDLAGSTTASGGTMKKVLVGSLLGLVVMLAWFVVVDGMLGLTRSIRMKQLPNERVVYSFLEKHVEEPGRYVCDPEVTPQQEYPGDDPIFVVNYSGLGHADAGQEMVVGLLVMLLALVAGAGLLGNSSPRVLSGYASRLIFFATIGFVVAIFGLLNRFGLGAHSLGDALILAAHDMLAWGVAGLVVCRIVRPRVQQQAE
jgi:hypothetical protein